MTKQYKRKTTGRILRYNVVAILSNKKCRCWNKTQLAKKLNIPLRTFNRRLDSDLALMGFVDRYFWPAGFDWEKHRYDTLRQQEISSTLQ